MVEINWRIVFLLTKIFISTLAQQYYEHLPRNTTVTLLHPRIGDSLGQESFLAQSADKQICNYDTECSNHHHS